MTVPFQFANASGTLPLTDLDANFSAVANNVATANTVVFGAQPNITTVGTLTSLSVTGNVRGGFFIGDGSQLSNLNIGNATGMYGNANVAVYLPTDPTIISIQSNSANTNSNVANLTTSVTGISANLANLTTSVNGITSSLANTNSNVANTNSNVANLTTSTNTRFVAVNSNVANTDANVTNLTNATANAIVSTNSNVSTLSNTVANNSSNITTLQGQVYTNSNVATYLATGNNITIVDIQNNVGTLQTQVTSLTGKVYTNANVANYLPTYTGVVSAENVNFGANITNAAPVMGGSTDKIKLYDFNNSGAYNYAIGAEAGGNIWLSVPVSPTSGFNFYGSGTVKARITTNGDITATGNISVAGIKTDNYYYANGTPVSFGGGSGNTGNTGFNGNSIYNIDGPILENADLTHGATAALILPVNGNTAAVQLNNTYGNILLRTGVGPAIVGSWLFDNTGNLSASGNITAANNVSANYFVGDGSLLTNLPGSGNSSVLTNATARFTLLSDNTLLSGTVASPQNFVVNTATPDIDLRTASGTGLLTQGNAANIIGEGTITISSHSHNWEFGATANLTIPGNLISNGSSPAPTLQNFTFDAAAGIITSLGQSFDISAKQSNTTGKGFDLSLAAGSGIANAGGNVSIVAGFGDSAANGSITLASGPYTWAFNAQGDLYLPGNTIAGDDIEGTGNFGFETPVNVGFGILTNAGSQEWAFGADGNLTAPGSITMGTGNEGVQLRSNTDGFGIYASITNITSGASTVVVTLADAEFPGPVTGTVRITGVVGETEANGFWGWQAVEVNEIQLYTDATLSTPVDGTTWSAYVSGGLAVSSGYNNLDIQGGSIAIISGSGQYWAFSPDGNLTLPSNTSSINYANGAPYGSGGGSGNATSLVNGTNSFSLDNTGQAILTLANTSGNIGTIQSISGAPDLLIDALTGNVVISADDTREWKFDVNGNLTVPGIVQGSIESGYALKLGAYPDETAAGRYLQVRSGDVSDHIHFDTSDNEAWNFYVGSDQKYLLVGNTGNISIGSFDSGNAATQQWLFDNTGTLTVPVISTGAGTSENASIRGTRKLVGAVNTWSTEIPGHTAFGDVAWTATSAAVQSAKITFVVQSNGTTYNWEQFDVSVCQLDGANAFVSVSNRLRQNNSIAYTEVSAQSNSGILEILLNPADGQTVAYVNYDAVEFNTMAD